MIESSNQVFALMEHSAEHKKTKVIGVFKTLEKAKETAIQFYKNSFAKQVGHRHDDIIYVSCNSLYIEETVEVE